MTIKSRFKPKPKLKFKAKPKPKPKPKPKTSAPILPSDAKASEPKSAPAPAQPASTAVGPAVEYKVVDHVWSPSEPSAAEALLNEQGQEGWQLTAIYPDPQRERTRWIFSR